MHALVVDDSRATRRVIGKVLTDLGFQVAEAGDGRQALERLSEPPLPRIVLVDWNMPEMDGFEFIQAVRADHRYAGLLLMMVSSESDANSMAKALDAGANEYVMKPFTADVIRDKLEMLGVSLLS